MGMRCCHGHRKISRVSAGSAMQRMPAPTSGTLNSQPNFPAKIESEAWLPDTSKRPRLVLQNLSQISQPNLSTRRGRFEVSQPPDCQPTFLPEPDASKIGKIENWARLRVASLSQISQPNLSTRRAFLAEPGSMQPANACSHAWYPEFCAKFPRQN